MVMLLLLAAALAVPGPWYVGEEFEYLDVRIISLIIADTPPLLGFDDSTLVDHRFHHCAALAEAQRMNMVPEFNQATYEVLEIMKDCILEVYPSSDWFAQLQGTASDQPLLMEMRSHAGHLVNRAEAKSDHLSEWFNLPHDNFGELQHYYFDSILQPIARAQRSNPSCERIANCTCVRLHSACGA